MSVRILVGDCLERLRTLSEESVHCVVTSPPYWGLRDYGVAGAIGLEPTLQEHLETIVTVFREVRRVLRSDGTCWLNLGDSYANDVKWGGASGGLNDTSAAGGYSRDRKHTGLKPKDLVGIPWRVAFALQADGWWLRSEIVWHKPNPMPESVRDRPTSAHEKLFLLTKAARYFYDAEAVRVPRPHPNNPTFRVGAYPDQGTTPQKNSRESDKQRGHSRRHAGFNDRWDAMSKEGQQASGANLRNVWTIPTFGFPEAHFATFPPKLVEPCIKAGTSEKGCCPECGTPWVRGMEVHDPDGRLGRSWHDDDPKERLAIGQRGTPRGEGRPIHRTSGWQPLCDCGAGDPIPCTVLDPFGGSGTVGLVASRLGRDAILIELNPEYAEMAERRIHGDAPLLADVEVSA